MKTAKKLMGILLMLTMVLTMTTTALAVDITINDQGTSAGNYRAYRLLKATNAVEDGQATDKFAYTFNEKYADLLRTLVAGEGEAAAVTQAQVIAYIEAMNEDDDAIRAFADAVYAAIGTRGLTPDYEITGQNVFQDVEQGYYLIAEVIPAAPDGENDNQHANTVSLVMLDTAGADSITVDTKESLPTIVKELKDKDDTTGELTDWQDSADYDIGDEIPYRLVGTVSDKIANYAHYYYRFTDTMTHLTLKAGSVAVTLVTPGQTDTVITEFFTINYDAAAKCLTIECEDLKQIADAQGNRLVAANSSIVVTYIATLDADANIGAAGNPNQAYLTYSRDPYFDGTGKPATNDTPMDTNIVFTFRGLVNKLDSENRALTGAGFTLYKWVQTAPAEAETPAVGEWVAVGQEQKGEGLTSFAFDGLDAGQYKLVETTVPAGYNQAADLVFIIEAVHDVKSDTPALTGLVVKDAQGNLISGEALTFAADMQTGTLSTDVINNAGAELPSTGGIGTVVFYTAGGILVVVAVVLLVSRKRMTRK